MHLKNKKLVSMKSDYVAKEIFGNEIVLRHFIHDVLKIPLEEIRTVSTKNTFLWKQFWWQKQGILDILVEFNDDTKIDMEIQLVPYKNWHKRQIFYLSKLYTADLRMGFKYERLRKCISIAILDYNLTDSEEYHNIYMFRDKDGNCYSDILEIHIIELNKQLGKDEAVDDWIRLFNVRTEVDLDMIGTRNPGIQEAIRELKFMSVGRTIREWYEAWQKNQRDQWAREEYVRDEGVEIGRAFSTVKSIHNVMKTTGVTLEEACRMIGYTKKEYEAATQLIENYDKKL